MRGITLLTALTTTTIYLVIILGAYTRALGAGMACGPDWPTCNGYIIPPNLLNPFVLLEYSHRVSAMLAGIFTITTTAYAWTRHRGEKAVTGLATLTLALLVIQILIGMIVVKLHLEAISSATHLATATATFGAATATLTTTLRKR